MGIAGGKYRARGMSGGLGYTNGGAPQVAVELQIVEDGEFNGETITWFGYFTEDTEDRTMESLRILGWKGDDLSNLEGVGDNDVRIVIEEEEYQGQVRSKVKWINKIGGLALKTPMTAQQAKAFAAQMKGKAIASRQAGGGAQPPPQTRPTQQSRPQQQQRREPTRGPHPDDGGDDGIPF